MDKGPRGHFGVASRKRFSHIERQDNCHSERSEESTPWSQSGAEKQILPASGRFAAPSRFAQNDTFERSLHEEKSLTTSQHFAVPNHLTQDATKRMPRANHA